MNTKTFMSRYVKTTRTLSAFGDMILIYELNGASLEDVKACLEVIDRSKAAPSVKESAKGFVYKHVSVNILNSL